MMLEGTRVVEFGGGIAASLASMILADLGANVIKVEPPEGDATRVTPAFETWNRGKRSIRMDLGSEAGRSAALDFCRAADVVVLGWDDDTESFPLSTVELSNLRPELICCEIPPFAEEFEHRGRVSEELIAAAAGLYYPSVSFDRFERPLFTPLPFASTYAGMIAATTIGAALVARDTSGMGQIITVPIHSAIFLAIGFSLMKIDGNDPVRWALHPLVTTYRCSDGRWIQVHAGTPKFMQGMIAALGIESWREEGLLDATRWTAEPHLVLELHRRLTEMFATHPAEYWETFLSDAGLCCAVCRTVEEWLSHPHCKESGLAVSVDTKYGPTSQPGPLIRVKDAPLASPQGLVELEDANGAWPVATERQGERRWIPAALDGVRVLDLCMILAGPTCGRTLAEFGADVIKIDGPEPVMIDSFWLDTSRGKRSIVVDLTRLDGLDILWKLIESADVIVENFRDGVADRLGIGYQQVAERNPGIVYVSMNCYGYQGPFSQRPGWEQLAQAASGMQTRYGGRDAQPMLAPYAVNDYFSGLSSALGAMAALHDRTRTGRGRYVTTALAASAGMLQSLYMFNYPGYERHEIEGRTAVGKSELSRLYEGADGWLYFDCPRDAWARVAALDEFASAAGTPASPDTAEGELANAIAKVFATHELSYWQERLVPLGAGVERVVDLEGLRIDPRVVAAGLIHTTHAEDGRDIEHIGLPYRLSGTPARAAAPVPVLGQDTGPILEELGFSEEEIVRLFEAGVVGGG